MTHIKLNLSALKKDSTSSNIENKVVDLVLEAEDIGHSNDIVEMKEGAIWEWSDVIELDLESKKDVIKDIKEWEVKEISGKKKKTMLSLNSIKSVPKTDAEKKEEARKIETKKNEDQAKRDKENRNTASTKHVETWEKLEEQELVSEDKKIVEEATKKIEKDLKAVDDTIASDKVQITLDKSLFDNYIPNYKGEKESKAQKKEKSAKNKEKKKRIRGPINKKKRNLLIVAMFLCILGAWGFVLYPHVYNSSDLKSDVIQVTQDSVREKVDLVLDSEWWENENTESDENDKIIESGEIETKDDINSENTEIKEKPKDDKTTIKNYLLDNYYK